MLKAAASFVVGIALLLGQFGSAAAISVISQGFAVDSGETCTGPVGCTVVLVTPPLAPWQANNPGGSGASWVSYNAGTGPAGGVVASPNSQVTPFAVFSQVLPSGPGTLTIDVWADDTASVQVDGGAALVPAAGTAPNFGAQDSACAPGALGCEPGEQGQFVAILGAGDHIMSVSVFQTAGFAFGAMWAGNFEPAVEAVPEPASILLLGSALAAAGVASRRRWMRK